LELPQVLSLAAPSSSRNASSPTYATPHQLMALLIRDVLLKQLNIGQNKANSNAIIAPDMGFLELGLDSLGIYQFAHSLNAKLAANGFGLNVSVLDLFETGNPAKLADYLVGKMQQQISNKRTEENGRKNEADEMAKDRARKLEIKPNRVNDRCGSWQQGMVLDEWKKNEKNTRNDDEDIPALNGEGISLTVDWQMPWIRPKTFRAICSQHRLFGLELVPAALQIQKFLDSIMPNSIDEVCQLENVVFQRKMRLADWPESTLAIEEHGNMQQLKLIGQESQLQFSSCFWSRKNANNEKVRQRHRFGLSENLTHTLIELNPQ
jgi:hypothetical protein